RLAGPPQPHPRLSSTSRAASQKFRVRRTRALRRPLRAHLKVQVLASQRRTTGSQANVRPEQENVSLGYSVLKFRKTELQLPFVHLFEKNVERFAHHGRLVHIGAVHFRLEPLLLVWTDQDIDGTIVPLWLAWFAAPHVLNCKYTSTHCHLFLE